ncbi:MAG: molecular chaperone Hsp90 [Phascolarctobacterium sp.]
MEKLVLDFVITKTNDLLAAPSACQEVKAAANAWLAAVGTAKEAEETAKYIAELQADIMPIYGLIAFGETELAMQIFGAQGVKRLKTHAQELKASGAKYCDCPACAACKAILDKKTEIL